MMPRFSTWLLDQAIAKERERQEQQRRERLGAAFQALEKLARQVPFQEAYIFGSLAKPHRFFKDSDIDIAFVGLKDENFFQAIAFLSRELGRDVDVLQLEEHPLRDKIVREGIKWKKDD